MQVLTTAGAVPRGRKAWGKVARANMTPQRPGTNVLAFGLLFFTESKLQANLKTLS